MVCEILASWENSLWTTPASWANAFRFGAGSSMIRRGRAQDLMQARREPGSDLPRTPHGRAQNLVHMRSGHDAVGVAFFLRPRESDKGRAAGEHRLRHRRRPIGRLEIARRPVLPAARATIRVEVCRKSEVPRGRRGHGGSDAGYGRRSRGVSGDSAGARVQKSDLSTIFSGWPSIEAAWNQKTAGQRLATSARYSGGARKSLISPVFVQQVLGGDCGRRFYGPEEARQGPKSSVASYGAVPSSRGPCRTQLCRLARGSCRVGLRRFAHGSCRTGQLRLCRVELRRFARRLRARGRGRFRR